jgi:hypothetical protein
VEVTTDTTDGRVSVRVAAAPGSDDATPLFARVYRGDDDGGIPLPIAVMPLRRDGDEYVGRAVVGAARDLVVDVYAAESVLRPRVSAASRHAASTDRAAAQDLLSDRSAGRGENSGAARRFAAEGAAE